MVIKKSKVYNNNCQHLNKDQNNKNKECLENKVYLLLLRKI